MEAINTFHRQEVKYVLSHKQYSSILDIIKQHVPPDVFSNYLVQSLYFDTDNWDIVRHSISKPIFKEKLRLRCYGIPGASSTIYLELKKKYKGIVHKRRIEFPMEFLNNKTAREIVTKDTSQTGRELEFYLRTNQVYEKAHISYIRTAFSDDGGLRITFDTNLLFRTTMLDYAHPGDGLPIIPNDFVIMEVKTLGGIPIWLANFLSKLYIFPKSFSKIGTGYKKYIIGKDV